jgi:hypothetical protein
MAFTLQAVLKFKDESKRGLKQAEGGFKNFDDVVKKIGATLGITFGTKAVLDIAKMGAQAERIERRFGAFAQAAGGAEQVLAAFQRGAGGAASKMDAMASSSQLLQMGLVGNAAEMERVVTMATRLGDQTQSVTDRVENFALLLANQSLPRLDSFGISSGKVRARIQELQAATEGMTRETAFMTAVMEQGSASLDILGPRVDDNAASFERMEAKMGDLAVTLGQAVAPAIVILIDALTSVIEKIAPIIEGFGEMVTGIEEVGQASDEVVGTLKAVSDETETAGSIAEQFANKMEVTAEKTSGLNDVILWLGNNSTILGNTASRADLLAAATDGLHEAAVGASESYEQYLGIIDEYNSKIDDSGLKTRALTEAQFEGRQAAGEWISGLVEQGRQLENVRQEADQADQVMFNLAQRTVDAREETKSYNQILAEGTEGFRNAERAAAMAADEWGSGASELEAFREKQAAAAASLEEWRARAAESTAATAAHRAEVAAAAADYTNLAMSLQGATEAQLAQNLISMLDPEAMGAEAFTAAVTDIGMEFGLMDEKSAALAANLPKLAEAIESGVIPAENAAEAMAAMAKDAEDGEIKIGALIGEFDRFPDSAEPANESAGEMAGQLETLAASGEPSVTMLDMLATNAQDVVGPMSDATQAANALETALSALGQASSGVGGPPPVGGGGFQMGGIITGGRIGEPRTIRAHVGEIVLNPFQPGALGGPGGPQPVTNNIGGDTFVNNVYDPMAAKVLTTEQYRMRRRRSRL